MEDQLLLCTNCIEIKEWITKKSKPEQEEAT
jgi:hypothetical protein